MLTPAELRGLEQSANQSTGAATTGTGTSPSGTGTSPTGTATNPTGTTGTGTSATAGSPPQFGPSCGTVTGGTYDYRGQTLTVHAGVGVSCATALRVMRDLSAGIAQNHQGPNSATSYFSVDGWTCRYGNMELQPCSKGKLFIDAYGPGAQP